MSDLDKIYNSRMLSTWIFEGVMYMFNYLTLFKGDSQNRSLWLRAIQVIPYLFSALIYNSMWQFLHKSNRMYVCMSLVKYLVSFLTAILFLFAVKLIKDSTFKSLF